MKKWLENNSKTIIVTTFLIPIIIVAIVSISHVAKWYGISNPISWSIYLSVGIELAALSSLAALSVNMGNKVYFPFIIVTLIQFIGNIFFSYSYIDVTTTEFKSWMELTAPIMDIMGVEEGDIISHKRVLALFSGGMLPLISLTFLHMLVKVNDKPKEVLNTEEEEIKEDTKEDVIEDVEEDIEVETTPTEEQTVEPTVVKENDEIKYNELDPLEWVLSRNKLNKTEHKDPEPIPNEVVDTIPNNSDLLNQRNRNIPSRYSKYTFGGR